MYIDPPLLQTQMNWRERNHLIHEESVKLAYKTNGSNPVFFLTSEDFSNKIDFAPEVHIHVKCWRNANAVSTGQTHLVYSVLPLRKKVLEQLFHLMIPA